MPFFVYVLRSEKDKKLYIGSTKDITKRLKDHNAGKSRSTRLRRPFALEYKEEYRTRAEAVKREWHFKNSAEDSIWLKKKLNGPVV